MRATGSAQDVRVNAGSRSRVVLAAAGASVIAAVSAAAGWGGRAVLRRQAARARAVIGKPLGEESLLADKTYRRRYDGRIDLLVVGDSIAAGLGAETPGQTFGARLAKQIAKRVECSVRLRTVARVGAETSMVAAQLDTVPEGYRPRIAVVVVGGNDVIHRVPTAVSLEHLRAAIDRLHALGAAVVVGTCPDLGALRPVPQPLRSLISRLSRSLASAQRTVALDAGARVVSLGSVVGPQFFDEPDEMFSLDRFHPSPAGYKRTSKAMLPSVLAALGEGDAVPAGHYAPRGAS